MSACFKCLRVSGVLNSVLLLVLAMQGAGAVLIWCGFRMKSMTLLHALREYDSEDFGWIVLSFGAGVAALGLLGVVASLDRSKCVLCLVTATQYLVPLLTLALAVAGAGSFALYLQTPVEHSLSTQARCLDEGALADSEDAVNKANNLICTVLCPCDYEASVQTIVSSSGSGKLLVKGSATSIRNCVPCEGLEKTLTAQQLPVVEKYLATQSLTLEKCQSMSSSDFEERFFSSAERATFDLLGWAEKNFDCAGVCTTAPMFLFSDINRGTPGKACRESLRNWVRDNLPIYGGITVAIGGWLLLAVALTLGLCCARRTLKPVPPTSDESNLACS